MKVEPSVQALADMLSAFQDRLGVPACIREASLAGQLEVLLVEQRRDMAVVVAHAVVLAAEAAVVAQPLVPVCAPSAHESRYC
jgi:hypothetical protein